MSSRKRARTESKESKPTRTMSMTRLAKKDAAAQGFRGGAPSYYLKPAFPMKLRRTLRYMENTLQLDPGVGGVAAGHGFSANGCYDPNLAVGGHQPLGFDELIGIYDHYKVRRAKITAYFHNTSNVDHNFVGIYVEDTNTLPSVVGTTLVENGKGVWALLSTAGTSTAYKALTLEVDIDKYFGGRKDDSTTMGSKSANPNDQVAFIVYCFNNAGSDSAHAKVDVIIDYDVEFIEPTGLIAS